MMKSPQFWAALAANGSGAHKIGKQALGPNFFGFQSPQNLTKASCEIILHQMTYQVIEL